ncbi:50S ribosomal protein L9 [bacterium]|nr:50S ribosomal protein L9 [bacterium]
MKVLLLEDVYNLGRAGEVKKVANGYGRNYLIPQGLAMLATPGAMAQAEKIQEDADKRRAVLNEEMSGVAEKLVDLTLFFAAKAGETGKLYGSITTQMIADELTKELDTEISKRQIDSQPLRLLGMHTIKVRLTIDLIPEFKVVVYREGESPENYMVDVEAMNEIGDEEAGYEEIEDIEAVEEEIADVEVVEEEIEAEAPAEEEEETEEAAE